MNHIPAFSSQFHVENSVFVFFRLLLDVWVDDCQFVILALRDFQYRRQKTGENIGIAFIPEYELKNVIRFSGKNGFHDIMNLRNDFLYILYSVFLYLSSESFAAFILNRATFNIYFLQIEAARTPSGVREYSKNS